MMVAKERKKQNCSIYARQLQQGSRFNQPICWRPQKLMEEKLQSSEGKFLLPKMLDAWMHNFRSITFQSSRSAFACSLAEPGLAFFFVIVYSLFFLADSILARAYCNLRNDLNETNWKSFTCEMNTKSVISKMESCICEMKICNLRKEDSCCKLHQPKGWIGQFVTSVDCNHNLAYNINYN